MDARGKSLLIAIGVLAFAPVRAAPPAGGKPAAKPAPAADQDDDEDGDIIVNGRRQQPGAVVGDIPPELQYSQADIRAYGVSSVTDLLNELAPEIRSDRGRGGEAPAVLLNGRRISSFSEIRDIPTEAILRVDILPEEVALKYGFGADQKVVNIVLRRRFRSLTAEGDGSTTTDGGASNGTAALDLLRIHGDSRINLDAKYKDTGSLTESQRGIVSSTTGRPYDLAGNVTGIPYGTAIPALGTVAGAPVTIAGVPASAANGVPSLGDFASTANIPDTTNISPYRTLAPASHELTLNAVLAHPVSKRITATINGTFDITDSDSLNGLAGTDLLVPSSDPFSPFGSDVALYRYLGTTPLRQGVDTLTGHLGFSLNGDIAKWRLSFTGNYDHGDTRTRTQTGIDASALQAAITGDDPAVNPFGAIPASLLGGTLTTHARAISNTGNVQLVAAGPAFDLPTGPLTTSVKVGISDSGFESTSDRLGVEQSTAFTRRDASGQLNLDLPLTSRSHHVLGAIGDLSANLNLAADQLSDFGTLVTIGYGLNWNPRDNFNLIASVTHDRAAPTVQQLGNPDVVTPDVRVFDYRTGQTVDVSEMAGGNASLQADHRAVEKLGLNVKPLKAVDLTLSANYIHSTIRNAISALPSPTAAIEEAFPDRFTRDAAGQLEAIDVRPVNFARETRTELRWGINFTQKIQSSKKLVEAYRALFRERRAERFGQSIPNSPPSGAANPGGDATRQQGGGDTSEGGLGGGGLDGGGHGFGGGGHGGFGGGGGRRGGGGPGGGFQGGRLQISVYHTWYFRDDILIRQGGPQLDLLDGGTTGSGGGQPRHQVDLQIGYTNNGFGIRTSGTWQSATTVDGGIGSPTGNLHFSSLGTANVRLFADLGSQASLVKHRWARGMRLTLSVTNILDTRQHVRDAQGLTPLSYQPAYLDPLGRTIRVSLRKLFF